MVGYTIVSVSRLCRKGTDFMTRKGVKIFSVHIVLEQSRIRDCPLHRLRALIFLMSLSISWRASIVYMLERYLHNHAEMHNIVRCSDCTSSYMIVTTCLELSVKGSGMPTFFIPRK